MDKQSSEKRFALLIDADNVSAKYIKPITDELSNYGTVTIKRIYGDWTLTLHAKWKDALLENSLTPIQQFGYTQGKNATDSAMIIDAMDILYTGSVEGFCIVSSDSDFTRLASRLRESGRMVIGMGEKKTPTPFRRACDVFTTLELLLDDANGKRKGKADAGSGPTIEEVEQAVVRIITDNQNNGKATGLGEVGSRLLKRFPDFDVRSYGTNLLSKLLSKFSSVKINKSGSDVSVELADDKEPAKESSKDHKSKDRDAERGADGDSSKSAGKHGGSIRSGKSDKAPSRHASDAVAETPSVIEVDASEIDELDAEAVEPEVAQAEGAEAEGSEDFQAGSSKRRRRRRGGARANRRRNAAETAREDSAGEPSEEAAAEDAGQPISEQGVPHPAEEPVRQTPEDSSEKPSFEKGSEKESSRKGSAKKNASEKRAEGKHPEDDASDEGFPERKVIEKGRSSERLPEKDASGKKDSEKEASKRDDDGSASAKGKGRRPSSGRRSKAGGTSSAKSEEGGASSDFAEESAARDGNPARGASSAMEPGLAEVDATTRRLVAESGRDGIEMTQLAAKVRSAHRGFKVRDHGHAQFRLYVASLGDIEVERIGKQWYARMSD